MDKDHQDDAQLRDALERTAALPPPTADDFESILRRAQKGRARLLGVALVVALFAGPAAGILIGMNVDDGGEPVTVATGDQGESGSGTEAPTSQDATAPAPDRATSSAGVSTSPGFFPGGPELVPLFRRTTADGVTMRVYRSDLPPPGEIRPITPECPPEESCPEGPPVAAEIAPVPTHCMPTTTLQAELSNEGAVDPGFVSASDLRADATFEILRASFFGVQEKSPAAWVAVRTSDSVTTVRVRFSDGAVDEMAPVDGFAVLAHAMPAPPQPTSFDDPEAFQKATLPGGTVEVLDGSGTVVAARDLSETYAAPEECLYSHPIPAPMPTPPPPVGPGAEPMPMPVPTAGVDLPAPVTTKP